MFKKILLCFVGTIVLSNINISSAQDNRVQYSANAVFEKITSEEFFNTIQKSIKSVKGDYLDIRIEDVIDLENVLQQLQNIKNHGTLNVLFNEGIPNKWKHKIAYDLLYANYILRNTGFEIVNVLSEDGEVNGFVLECNVDNINLPDDNLLSPRYK